MQFESHVTVKAPIATVWAFFQDIPGLVGLVPGCKDAEALSDRQYKVHVSQRVGPFKVGLPAEVTIEELVEPERMTVVIAGTDRRVGFSLKQTLSVRFLQEGDQETAIAMVTDVSIFGKLASLGSAAMNRKAAEIMKEFEMGLRKALEPSDGAA